MALTDTERRISELLKNLVPSTIHSFLDTIELKVIQSPDKSKIMILKVPAEIIEDIKSVYKKYMAEMKRIYPDYFFYMIRQKKEEAANDNTKKLHENWVCDLAYPALVQGRYTVVTSDGKVEEAVIERKFYLAENELKIREHVFKHLTSREIKFSMRDY